jgi:hypothetical protein
MAIRRTLELQTLDRIRELQILDQTPARQIRERRILLQLPRLAPAGKNSCNSPLGGPEFRARFFKSEWVVSRLAFSLVDFQVPD